MKRMKKLLAVMLAAIMVMSMGTSAFAASATYELTIQSTTNSDHTYTAYQIFSGDLANDGVTLTNIAWGSDVSTTGLADALLASTLSIGTVTYNNTEYETLGALMKAYFTDSSSVTATGVASLLATYASNSDFAEAFAEFIKGYTTGSGTSTSTASTSTNSNGYYTYTISGLSAGYYLITDSYTGSAETEGNTSVSDYILKVVASTTVTSKAVYSTITKTVGSATSADAYIGESLDFTLTVSVPDITDYSDGYVATITDTLSNGLTYDSNSGVTVTITGTDATGATFSVSATKVDSGNAGYTLEVPSGAGGTITVSFANLYSYLTSLTVNTSSTVDLTKGVTITIAYKAALNSSAVIGSGTAAIAGNYNTATLTYSNNPNDSTSTGKSTSTVNVYAFALTINKIDSNGQAITSDNASFVLYKTEGGTNYYYSVSNGVISWVTDEADATTITTSDGTVTVSGLEDGTYYLKETEAPDGYNLDSTVHTIVIEATYDNTGVTSLIISSDGGTATDGDLSTGTVTTKITNSKGTELPATGGIGTTMFYVVGMILVLGAAVMLVTRRRVGR